MILFLLIVHVTLRWLICLPTPRTGKYFRYKYPSVLWCPAVQHRFALSFAVSIALKLSRRRDRFQLAHFHMMS